MKKLVIIFLLGFCFNAQAQFKKPYFNTLDVKSGLPEANVQTTLEDKNGYLWMGTQNGLVRYDGYQFKPYPLRNSKGNIVAPVSIRNLLQDGTGKIWVYSSRNEINFYDERADKFVQVPFDQTTIDAISNQDIVGVVDDLTNNTQWLLRFDFVEYRMRLYKFNTSKNTLQEYAATSIGKQQLPVKTLTGIIKDANGKIWLAGDSLLSVFEVKNQQFTPYFSLPKNLKGHIITQIIADPADDNILWMNTYNGPDFKNFQQALAGKNVLRFNIKTKAYQLFTTNGENATALPANCKTILTDSLKRIWLATDKGISLFNTTQNHFTNYAITFTNYANNLYQENSFGNAICADAAGNVWVGGNFQSLYFLDTKTGLSHRIETNTYEGSLPAFGNGINKIFYDRSGTLWVSMPWAGIAYFDKQRTLFAPTPLNPNGLSAVAKKKENQLDIKGSQGDSIFFVADTTGLYAWHIRSNQYNRIDLRNKDAYKNIQSVVAEKDGSVWVAGQGNGLFKYNTKTKAVKKWEHNAKDSLSLPSNNLSQLAIDKEGTIWLGTTDRGLCSYNPLTDRFTNFPFIPNNIITHENGLDDEAVISLIIDSEGIIWIGTNNGALNSYHPATKQFKSYLNLEQGFSCVLSILEDSQKRLWAGTYLSGLYLINKQTGIVKKYSEADGLLHNGIESIIEDSSGNIWCSTVRGYSRLTPASNRIVNFPIDLIRPIIMLPHLHKDALGTIYQSYTKGVVGFNPADIQPNAIVPSVVIEVIKYRAAKTDKDTLQYTTANQAITLNYNENKIEFQFVALHFTNADNNKYAFQLTGYDKDWVQAGTNRIATYTNLSPGTYTFTVKAANSDGVWNEKGTSITIEILPPWWKTWWAYGLYVLFSGGAIWWYVQYRSKALLRENQLLEQKVSLRTEQLEQKSIELETSLTNLKQTQAQLIQSEKLASLGELTAGIAHEIQNPLNFVNNFSEVSSELVTEMKEEMAVGNQQSANEIADDLKQNLEKITHHGKRASSIVKGMLEHSKASSGEKELTDINALADEYLRLSYHGLRAKNKDFNSDFKTDFDPNLPKVNIIPQDIGRVLLNLINNAFYASYESQKPNPMVTVTTKLFPSSEGVRLDSEAGGWVTIAVKDNGNGMSEATKAKIFQPFFTTKPTGQGTGLGLSLAYDIVTKGHGGTIECESTEGEGTDFIVKLPI